MPESRLSLSVAPPITITCRTCGKQMRLLAVEPTAKTTVYAYQCVNGHWHEIVTGEP